MVSVDVKQHVFEICVVVLLRNEPCGSIGKIRFYFGCPEIGLKGPLQNWRVSFWTDIGQMSAVLALQRREEMTSIMGSGVGGRWELCNPTFL